MNSGTFFSELKRRNVYKVAVAYAVVAWLLIQIATQVFPFFEIPNWAIRLVVLLLIIGFPVALILAWAFELTPQGIKRTEEVNVATAGAGRGKHVWLYVVIAAGILSVVVFYIGRYSARRAETLSAATGGEKAANSIAVLPFDNLSSDKENDYFASGIQDEILTKLAAVDGLKVIARSSTEKYRSHPEDIRKVAAELGAATILEGSVQKSGQSAHINVQLIDGAANTHIWAQTFNRELKNIFAVEGEVAEQVTSALKLKLLPTTSAKLAAPPTKDPEAYDLYLRGLYAHQEWFRGAGNADDPIRFMREAVARDPGFVAARARLATYETQKYAGGLANSPELASSARAHANEAIALDPDSAEALWAKAIVAIRIEHDYVAGLRYCERARDREPGSDHVWFMIGLSQGWLEQWQQAIEATEHAVTLSPRNAHYLHSLAVAYAVLRQPRKALDAIERARAVEPENWSAIAAQAGILIAYGQLDAAADVLRAIPRDVNITVGPDVAFLRWRLATYRRDFNAALAAANEMQDSTAPRYVGSKELLTGWSQRWLGHEQQAQSSFQQGRSKVEAALGAFDDESLLHERLARLLAALKDEAGALAQVDKAISLTSLARRREDNAALPTAQDPDSAALLVKAEALMEFGHKDEAIRTLQQVAQKESSGLDITPANLKLDPRWDSLRGDPRFEQLISHLEQKTGR